MTCPCKHNHWISYNNICLNNNNYINMLNCLYDFSSGNVKVSELSPYHQIVVEGEPILICCDLCEYGNWFLNGVDLDLMNYEIFINNSNYKHTGEYLYVGMTSNVEFKASVTVVCTFIPDIKKNLFPIVHVYFIICYG